jgi:phage gpG-like protein
MSFTLTHNTEVVAARLRGRGAGLRSSVQECFGRIALWLQRDIQTNALEGQVLHHRSGKLIGSIRQWLEWGGNYTGAGPFTISAVVQGGGGVAPYGEIHEYGGTFTIPAHMSTSRLGNPFQVRAHSATFPERSFMRSRLHEGEPMFLSWIERAVGEGIQR